MDKGAGKESSGHALNVPNEEADNVSKLSSDAKADELYPGCTASRTAFVEQLLKIKSSGGWTDKSIDMLLLVLIDLFPKGNTIPRSHDEAVKIIQNSDINKGPKADQVLSPGSCPRGKDSGRNAGSNEAGPSSTSSRFYGLGTNMMAEAKALLDGLLAFSTSEYNRSPSIIELDSQILIKMFECQISVP